MINERTIYKKARAIGFSVHKGKVHLLDKGYPIFSDEVGYTVTDNSLNVNVWGSYNGLFDHLWSLEDVEEFLKSEYSKRELIF